MGVSWLKKGDEGVKLAQQAKVEAEQKAAEQGKMWRFFIKKDPTGKENNARVTFIDGELNAEGFLVPPRFYEHQLFLNNSWNNMFVCPEKTNPGAGEKCPICESGDRPSLVALFTVIDHREYKSQAGKVFKNTRKLFVAKPQTFEILNKYAAKRGGLAGWTVDISRVGDKAPAVGDVFDFVKETPLAELKATYKVEKVNPATNEKTMVSYFEPADYDHEIVYRTSAELAKLLGAQAPQSSSTGYQQAAQTMQDETDYSKEL